MMDTVVTTRTVGWMATVTVAPVTVINGQLKANSESQRLPWQPRHPHLLQEKSQEG